VGSNSKAVGAFATPGRGRCDRSSKRRCREPARQRMVPARTRMIAWSVAIGVAPRAIWALANPASVPICTGPSGSPHSCRHGSSPSSACSGPPRRPARRLRYRRRSSRPRRPHSSGSSSRTRRSGAFASRDGITPRRRTGYSAWRRSARLGDRHTRASFAPACGGSFEGETWRVHMV